MKVSFMQKVDYWAGIPLCFALSLWHKLKTVLVPRQSSSPSRPAPPRRIMFIELSEMGSAVIAYSALVKAKKEFPESELFFLIFKKNRESVDILKVIPPENILVINDSSLFAFAVSLPLVLLKIWRSKIDTAIDMELFSRCTALVSYLSGASNRVGFDNYLSEGLYRGSFLTHRVFYNHHQHMGFNFLALLYALKAPASEHPMLKRNVKGDLIEPAPFAISEGDRQTMRERLAEGRGPIPPSAKLLVFNPDPGLLPLRGWPRENFVALARRLSEAIPESVIVCVGLSRSKSYAEELAAAVPSGRFIDMCGRTADLKELMVLLDLSELLITNDSGPAHMATLTSAKVFVLFGPETPALYAPLGPRVHCFFANFACSPCYAATNHRRTSCMDNKCLQAISVEEVFERVLAGTAHTYL